MGSAQPANRNSNSLFREARYQRLPHSPALLSQPLLQDQTLFTEIEYECQAYWEKCSALEKEIDALKSSFSRLETIVQTSVSKLQSRPTAEVKEGAITSLKEKVDYLKKNLDGIITGGEADKRIYSAGFSNQGLALKRLEEKNIEVDKEIAELKTRVGDMTSTMVDMAAVVAELKHESLPPKDANESAQLKVTDLEMITISKEELYIVLIFLIAVLLGLNL